MSSEADGKAAGGVSGGGGYGGEGRSGGRSKKKKRAKTLLDELEPRVVTHQVEGLGMVDYDPDSPIKEIGRSGFLPGLQPKHDPKDAAYRTQLGRRSKIKEIADPEAGKAGRRRRSARAKQKGRAGTLLSEGNQTLG